MEYTPLADPFNIQFRKDGIEYKAKVTYAKSKNSCANFFNVVVEWPTGIEPICLKEKAAHHGNNDTMIWMDEQGRESVFYDLIGNEIASQMKQQLGVVLLDSSVADKQQSENF
jgi:hypothetical protein